MNLASADLLAVEREFCKRSLAEFAKRSWRVLEPAAELKWGWALDAICMHLEAVTDGKVTRLLINVPPGSMKSLLAGVIWPAWEWGPRGMPWKRFIGTAHEEQLAIRDSRRCRDLIKSDWYQRLWPIELLADLDGKREFGNTGKGIRQARSFTSMTGVRGDCLLAGSIIQTEDGYKTIEEIVDGAYSGSVLSYDHDSSRVVYRSVEAVARRSSPDFYRVHFADGSLVKCTGDHRIYTDRGYVKASLLSKGDACLRVLLGRGDSDRGGHEETHAQQVHACDLLQAVQPSVNEHGSGEAWAALHGLQHQDQQGEEAVLPIMQGRSIAPQGLASAKTNGSVCLPGVQRRKAAPKPVAESEVMLHCMQGRSSCGDDARAEQSGVAKWGKRQEVRQGNSAGIQVGARDCEADGWGELCGLPINTSPALPPCRSQLHQQSPGEFGNAVPGVPHETSWCRKECVKTVAVSLVERVYEKADVFDIQVGVTHCFFANGILVHNCIILDDPISADSANSQAKLEAARISFTETLPTRVNSEKSAIVVIMQRLNEQDVSGVILEMGFPYVHLCIPMRFDPATRCTTAIGWSDPRTEEGELMFPERFSEEQVRELEKTLGAYGSAGQLQQRPSPRGGGIINIEWFRYWRDAVPKLEFRFITVDTAQKTADHNDWSVMQAWARSTVGQAIKLDQVRGKWEAPELLVQARAFWMKHLGDQKPMCQKAALRGMYVEDKVSGTGLIQTLRREGIPVVPVQRNKDKISRGYDAAPFIESGNVLLPEDAPWLSGFLAEVASFPTGSNDDQLDPMFDAINLVQRFPAAKVVNFAPLPVMHKW